MREDLLELIDHPAVNTGIFFPRPDPGLPPPPGSEDVPIEVEPGIQVAARFHPSTPERPTVLHFHGNGEIVTDYDELAPAFHAAGASLVCAEFRGYGRSTGQPSVRALVRDAHPILRTVCDLLAARGHTGPLVLMGRSLGSAPAIELASSHGDLVAGLIVESGFARTIPLLGLLGIAVSFLGLDSVKGRDNEDKMSEVTSPLLLLHAEQDLIVPLWHAERNHERASSRRKKLVIIPEADHNSIIGHGGRRYWGAIQEFLESL